MNEDQTPLFEDAESSNSDILRVARERAEVAYLKAKRDGIAILSYSFGCMTTTRHHTIPRLHA